MPLNPKLSAFRLEDLLAEVQARFDAATGVVPVEQRQPQADIPFPRVSIIPGTDRGIDKNHEFIGFVKGEPRKDGTPRALLSVGSRPPEPVEEGSRFGGTQFIVRGAEREQLAHDFINQWKSEIAELEAALASTPEDSPDTHSIRSEIQQLRDKIALRADSAFGGLSFSDVMARNEAANGPGSTTKADALAAVPGRGARVIMASGFREWDAPEVVDFVLVDGWTRMQRLNTLMQDDPICGHVPDKFRATVDKLKVHVHMVVEPSVVYRLTYHLETICKAENIAPSSTAFYKCLQAEVEATHTGKGAPLLTGSADMYRRAWTDVLRMQFERGDEYTRRSLKRAVRILNPDFQEMEAPDSMYEISTDGENPLGVENRPHVNTREVWSSVEESPGVFKMKRPVKPNEEED